MHNVQMAVKGNVLTITVDLSQPGTISKTGKSTIIGSTGGWVSILPGAPGAVSVSAEIKVGLNVLGPLPKAA